MRTLRIIKKKSEEVDGGNQLTGCCQATTVLTKAGNELLLRCSKCGEYIGNVVDREIALVATHYEEFIKAALRDQQVELIPLEEHLEEIYPTYCRTVLKFAEQAARTALSAFFRGKTP